MSFTIARSVMPNIGKLSIIALLILSWSCGPVEHKVTGTVNVSVDLEKLAVFFRPLCQEEIPNGSNQEIENCTAQKIGEFINLIMAQQDEENQE